MDASGDWKDVTFSLTIQDAARLLETTPQSVIDLMLAGQLGFYMRADPAREGGLPVDCARFDPADVTAFFEREHARYATIALPVLTNLRQYLRNVPRTRDYDTALKTDRPIQTRTGLHVRTAAVVGYARNVSAPPAAQMASSTEVAFERLGLLRVRSMSPYGDKQRWGTWYRLPEVIMFEGETLKIDSYLRPRGTLALDEQLIEAPDGSGPVVAQPLHEGG